MYPLKINEKYDQNNLTNLGHRFTVPYLGTYIDGDFREYVGSHPGVDIIPISKNQEILSILDAKVFKAGEDGAYGKYVFLEHKNVPHPDDLTKTTTLYSCYEHLSEIKVAQGDSLKEGDVIGKTGTTGNSFGEHLHFQIDKVEAPFHAYWPFTGAEAKAAGQSFSGGVNIGLGLDKAKLYTINPLVYLDKVSEYRKNGNVSTPRIEEIKKEEIPVLREEPVKVENYVLNTPIVKEVIETPVMIEVKKEETPIITNNTVEKINVVSSNDDIIVSDPSIDFLSSLADDKKKL